MRQVQVDVDNTSRTGRSTKTVEYCAQHALDGMVNVCRKNAEPQAAASYRRMELQVRKLLSTVFSTHRTGWSTSAAKSAEPKAVERDRRMELQVQKLWSTVLSTHRTG